VAALCDFKPCIHRRFQRFQRPRTPSYFLTRCNTFHYLASPLRQHFPNARVTGDKRILNSTLPLINPAFRRHRRSQRLHHHGYRARRTGQPHRMLVNATSRRRSRKTAMEPLLQDYPRRLTNYWHRVPEQRSKEVPKAIARSPQAHQGPQGQVSPCTGPLKSHQGRLVVCVVYYFTLMYTLWLSLCLHSMCTLCTLLCAILQLYAHTIRALYGFLALYGSLALYVLRLLYGYLCFCNSVGTQYTQC
jgi:hypothetical protein